MKTQDQNRFRTLLLKHLSEVKGALIAAVLCLIGFTLTALLGPWPVKIIFDYIILLEPLPEALSFLAPAFEKGSVFALGILVGALMLIALLQGFFSYFQVLITSRISFHFVYVVRRALFTHLQHLSLSFHDHARSGELLTKISGDTKVLKELFSESALNLIAHFMKITGMLVVMFLLDWKLTLLVSLSFPPLMILLFYTFQKIKDQAKKQRREEGQIASRISELLATIPLVQSYARESYETARFEADSTETLQRSIQITRLTAMSTRQVEIVCTFGIAAAVFFGSQQVLSQWMTPGDLLVFISYLKQMYTPMKKLPRLLSKFSKARVSAERIATLFSEKLEIQDAVKPIKAKGIKGEITFKDVSFAYETGPAILDQVSFSIAPGERVALVGASGAGKSSIAKLLLRLYEFQSGEILIDGVDIRQYERESLRHEITLVLQESILLGASIRENIAYGKPEAKDTEIEAAAILARADTFIDALPDRYETRVGEGGCTLSGGQRQRIALARAIIRQPAILILDEPTAALDAESARDIQEAMAHFQKDRTALVIVHHFASIKDFDRIIVLKAGKVIQQGSHQALIAEDGRYRTLCRLQGVS
ncbi:MAG: ABC transporter ATP-binding protein [Nitrospirae bacterium]|nr:ABC transporter ATP-binding protein [Candidatus Manganitrophaceae bacterium]